MNYEHGQWQAGGQQTVDAGVGTPLQRETAAASGSFGRRSRSRAWIATNCSTSPRTWRWKARSSTSTIDYARQTAVSRRLSPRPAVPLHAGHHRDRRRRAAAADAGSWIRPKARCPMPEACTADVMDLPKLVELAERWIDESRPARGRIALAGRATWSSNLATSGQFQYSLAGQDRDPNIDPIEDFVTKHPQGHCEYFATALTLMLRSQGIPARMVVGLQVRRRWNAVGGYYQVRQLHAHTWVEAYLRPEQLPAELHARQGSTGTWRAGLGRMAAARSDARPATAAKATNWFTPVRNAARLARRRPGRTTWWNSTAERQRDAIYQPIADAVRSRVASEVTDAERWRAMFDSVAGRSILDHLSREAAGTAGGVVGIVLSLAALAGVGLAAVADRPPAAGPLDGEPRPAARSSAGSKSSSTAVSRACWPGKGWSAPPAQTQREFAAAAGHRLAALTGESRGWPRCPAWSPTPSTASVSAAAPGQSPDPGGRTCIGRNRGNPQEHGLGKPRPTVAEA